MKVAIFQLGLFGINTYIVYDEITRDCAIIDPGMSTPEEERAVTEYIEKQGLYVTHIINTHLHIDHAIGDDFVSKKYGISPKAHKADLPLGRGLKRQAQMFGLGIDVKDPEISEYIEDGDIIKIGTGELKAIHVPGHSPGSIVLYDSADGFIIAGDVLFRGSIGRTDLEGGDYATLINGIKDILLPLPSSTIVYPGHGPYTTIGDERASNPFLR